MPQAPPSFMALCRQYITTNIKYLLMPGKFSLLDNSVIIIRVAN